MKKLAVENSFKSFAVNQCRGSSELYEYLSMEIAEDDDLLEICLHSKEGQPIPNLFFAAVQYLLFNGKQHGLRDFYKSIVSAPKAFEDSFPSFKDFCMEYSEEIISLLQIKFVQTNEVRRCGYLYPCFCYIYEKTKKPLALIEIGTSAGLQLLWDKYSYSYGTDKVYGNNNKGVHIKTEVHGKNAPFLLATSPPVANRIGLDLHVNNLSDIEDIMWLNALIWPEHKERRELFFQAANEVKKANLNLIEGDGVSKLARIIERIPMDVGIVVFHTHVANQFPKSLKKMLLEQIDTIGMHRDIFHIYNNMYDQYLHLDYLMRGIKSKYIVGKTDAHGRWFTWQIGK